VRYPVPNHSPRPAVVHERPSCREQYNCHSRILSHMTPGAAPRDGMSDRPGVPTFKQFHDRSPENAPIVASDRAERRCLELRRTGKSPRLALVVFNDHRWLALLSLSQANGWLNGWLTVPMESPGSWNPEGGSGRVVRRRNASSVDLIVDLISRPGVDECSLVVVATVGQHGGSAR